MLKLAWHFAEAKPETVANTIESKMLLYLT